jgi:hypothetical protein
MNPIRRFLWLFALLLTARTAEARTDVTGTWTGTLPVDGIDRPAVIQLHQRGDGSVMGYLLGGTSARTVHGGSSAAGRLTLAIERAEPGRTVTVAVDARLRGDRLRGTAAEGGTARSISWTRGTADVCERRLLVAPGGGEAFVEVAVATDCAGGRLLAGSYEAAGLCGPIGCGGAVTAFSETGGTLSMTFTGGGSCPVSAGMTATFDPAAKAYRGGFSGRNCQGPVSGPLFAARWTRTRATHAAAAFAVLGRVADDLEAGVAFGASYAPVSPSYLHFGRKASDLLADLRSETALYTGIQVTFDRFRGFDTVPDPGTFPDLVKPPGVDFHDARTGTPRGGGPAVTYRDTVTGAAHSELKHLRAEAGVWRIAGNQSAPFDLPFAFYEASGEFLAVPPSAAGGGLVYASVGPWGAHFSPLTGHAYGDPKSNLVGFFSKSQAEMREILGDGVGNEDGLCQAGEACAYPTTAESIRDRTPVYAAPLPGRITEVAYEGPAPDYFDGAQRWSVRLRLDVGLEIRFDHLARIAPALRGLILDRTGIDTDSYAGPDGDVLGGAALPVSAGMELARPQVFAREVPGNPGLFQGGGSFGDRPWAQMEIFVGEDGADLCVYDLLPAARRGAIQATVDAEMRNPASQRYGAYQGLRWTWAAEGLLCPAAPPAGRLFAGRGAWFEAVDELFAIVPVARSASYDPGLYSPGVQALVLRRRSGGAPFSWRLADGTAVSPFYPNAEVLARTPTSLFLLWRDAGPVPLYQRAALAFSGSTLKIAWGPLAATPAGATAPALDPAAPCDHAAVFCYGQEGRPGF